MARNRDLRIPPIQWVDLIERHDQDLDRIRMLWRRGGGEYRPMVPREALADAEDDDGGDWDALELEETHFEWISGSDESPSERRERISETVGNLWDVALRWTVSIGAWCDFQLVGHDSEGRIVFCDGKRCHFRPSRDSGDSGERIEGGVPDWTWRRDHDRRMDTRVNEFLDRMSTERNKSFETAGESLATAQRAFASVQESIDAAPRLLSKASEVLKEAIEYQSEQNRQIRDQSSGRLEMRAKAFAEMERSRRAGMIVEFLKFGVEAGIANLLPFANRLVEVLGNRNITVFPEFKNAQQAMAYLVLDLSAHQLRLMFGESARAQAAVIGLLDDASQMPNERDALMHVAELVVRVFRTEEWRGIATPEQQLAGRFIIGRLALYRMADYGEDQPEA